MECKSNKLIWLGAQRESRVLILLLHSSLKYCVLATAVRLHEEGEELIGPVYEEEKKRK